MIGNAVAIHKKNVDDKVSLRFNIILYDTETIVNKSRYDLTNLPKNVFYAP